MSCEMRVVSYERRPMWITCLQVMFFTVIIQALTKGCAYEPSLCFCLNLFSPLPQPPPFKGRGFYMYTVFMKTCIVIPTYNEAENIVRLIEVLLKTTSSSLCIVDDNSPDETANLVEQIHDDRIHVIQRSGKQGLGSAYKEGFDWALKQGFKIIVQMDADFSHDPHEAQGMIDQVKQGYLVLGSRYIPDGKITGWGVHRHLASRGAMVAARMYLGLEARDVTTGFRFWSSDLLAKVLGQKIQSNSYAFQEEMLFHAYRLNGTIVESPITFKDREVGASKLGFSDIKEFFSVLVNLRKQYGPLKK
jgi:dolichol-phosphate mannosyltransferase